MRDYAEKLALMKDCRRYIDAHLDELIDMKQLADHYGYAYPTFRKFFVQVGGYSPYQYVRLRRIQRAAHYLRKGGHVTKAAELSGYETLSGFNRAFEDVYGVTSSEFAATRGRILMCEPRLEERPPFCLVGYVLKGLPDMREEERGAYWIAQTFPDVSAEEFEQIGGGPDSVALWAERDGSPCYILGPPVPEAKYVPEQMTSEEVAGGLYALFPIPASADNSLLFENVRVTWFFAREQWLPQSEYEEDTMRTAYEYYLENANAVCIPVRPRNAT